MLPTFLNQRLPGGPGVPGQESLRAPPRVEVPKGTQSSFVIRCINF